MAERRVSVLVVTYGSGQEIGACLDAALSQAVEGRDLEVIVVDNASPDDSAEIVRGYGDDVELIELDRNVGFAEGVNTAYAASAGDTVLLLNPDCAMEPGCLAALCEHLDNHADVGAAAAVLHYTDGRPQLFARREMTLADVLWGRTELGYRVDRVWRKGAGDGARRYAREFEGGLTEPLDVDAPAAACVAVRGSLLSPRPLDPAFPLMFNDTDLWMRLRKQGWRVQVVPTATAEHGYGTSLRRVPRARMRAEWVDSLRRYAARWWPVRRRLALAALLVADIVTSAVMGIVGPRMWRGRARANARGTAGGLGLPFGAKPWMTGPE